MSLNKNYAKLNSNARLLIYARLLLNQNFILINMQRMQCKILEEWSVFKVQTLYKNGRTLTVETVMALNYLTLVCVFRSYNFLSVVDTRKSDQIYEAAKWFLKKYSCVYNIFILQQLTENIGLEMCLLVPCSVVICPKPI